ncbi:MAG: heavy metal translocating P-type ATPase [Betaproteobacteria bacterium]|nr:heavy metal translocating P-type ATPase [Betaproteobacteria bacterium]
MTRHLRSIHLALLVLALGALAGGLLLQGLGRRGAADAAWAAAALPVAAVLAVSVARALWRREAGVDLLALLALVFALVLGQALTAAVIAVMLAGGRALEDYAAARAEREMTALLRHAPRGALRFEAGEWRPVPLEQVRQADRLLVRHGELVPVDATLLGPAQFDESMLSGESLPRLREAGEGVASGVLNLGPAVELLAARTAAQSTFAGIVRMVQVARAERGPGVRLADRYAGWLIVLALAAAGAAWAVSGDSMRALAVLVVATPCPLILAVPVAVVSGLSSCARHGILVKGGGALERLAQAEVLFFDKTGTLTGGRPRLVDVVAPAPWNADELLRSAAAVAQASHHAISEAVVLAARERGLDLPLPSGVLETPGAGVSGMVGARRVEIGAFEHVARGGDPPAWARSVLARTGADGSASVFVAVDGALAGAILLADRIRIETPRALRLLRAEGIRRVVMLTGDRAEVAQAVGNSLGGLEVLAGQSPADKLAAIGGARAHARVVMVGDGVNDAPALAAADVGVAMGARGAAASAEAADVVLLVDRLDKLVDALRIARRSRRIAVQSMAVGMGLSLAAMGVAMFGYLPPLAGALLQELIDLAAIANALRALRPGRLAIRGLLAPEDARRLREEHVQLEQVLESLRAVAEGLPRQQGPEAVAALQRLDRSLNERLLPHERLDERELLPRMGRLVGGEDPMAALSSSHREIFRLLRLIGHGVAQLPPRGPDAAAVAQWQRLLYALEAIMRLHMAQEDELFHALGGEGAEPPRVARA